MNYMKPEEREVTLEELVARGEEADKLLNSQLAHEIRAEMKLRIVEEWKDTPADAVAERELQYATFRAMDVFDGVLRDIINDGHHAAAIREQREKALNGE